MARIPVKPWRGTDVSIDMLPALDEWARRTRRYLQPIPGYGSYRANKASGGTDTGSGHVDISCDGWTYEEMLEHAAAGRALGLAVFARRRRWFDQWLGKWRQPGWQSHLHVLLEGSADLSPAARRQLAEYHAGGDGLVGPAPDDGDRRNVGKTWAQAAAEIAGQVGNVAKTVAEAARRAASTRPIKVNLAAPIRVSNLRHGRNHGDVARLQAALWNFNGTGWRWAFLVRWHMGPGNVVDGKYGPRTGEMVQQTYAALAKAEPHGGWTPRETEPGTGLLRRLGFTDVRP